MKMTELKKMYQAVCIAVIFGIMAACGGGGGGGGGTGSAQPTDKSKYTGLTARASINTGNATAFTTDAFAAGSIGSTASVIGVMVDHDTSPGGKLTTLPEIAGVAQGALAQAVAQKAASASVAGVASNNTLYGAAGGSAAVSMNLDETSGNFSGSMTFSNYQSVSNGPIISGSVTMSGIYNKSTSRYDSITMVCSPLSATTAKGTATIYGSFAFGGTASAEVLKMSCTASVNSSPNYWVKDWTYTFTGNTLTISGVYYHPQYGYVEITTPTPLTAPALSGIPTSGVFQAAGAHCSKARLTFTATGTTITATGDDGQWQVCTE